MNVPARAQNPPSSLPVNVCGDLEKCEMLINYNDEDDDILDMVTNSGHSEDAPPYTVQERPLSIFEL